MRKMLQNDTESGKFSSNRVFCSISSEHWIFQLNHLPPHSTSYYATKIPEMDPTGVNRGTGDAFKSRGLVNAKSLS